MLGLLISSQAVSGQTASTETIDVEALLREVQQHQAENRQRLIAEYVYKDKDTQRPGFVPLVNEEKIAATLSGTLWIDAADKMLVRQEAHSPELKEKKSATPQPGARLTHENRRLPEGVWVPGYSQLILRRQAYPFLGRDIHTTHEYSDYKRFSTNVQDVKTDEQK